MYLDHGQFRKYNFEGFADLCLLYIMSVVLVYVFNSRVFTHQLVRETHLIIGITNLRKGL